MAQQNLNNLRNRPKATEYAEEQAARGTGQLESVDAYLRNDPISYYFRKFSDSQNEFLRTDFWSEAAKRGESESLVGLLGATKEEGFSDEAYKAVAGYGDRMDYDTYMLALQLPHLDDSEKSSKPRIDEDRYDEQGNLVYEGSGYDFGTYTDQGWAWEILKNTMGRWDAEIIEEMKADRGWLADVGSQFAAGTMNLVGGASNFLGDIWNFGEGLLNVIFNWTHEDNTTLEGMGDRFTYAFSNDEGWSNPFAKIGDWLNKASYEFQRNYASTVNAVHAFDEGYRIGEGSNWMEQIDNSTGSGAGMTTWGRWMNGMTQAIGYMLPTIILAVATGGASTAGSAASVGATAGVGGTSAVSAALGIGNAMKAIGAARSAIFYAGIFSGMVKDTVETAKMNGISYRDLNSGQVLGNAALKAGAQYAVEMALGGIMGFSGVDKIIGVGGKTASGVAAKTGAKAAAGVTGNFASSVGRYVGRIAKDAVKEGLEETLQELSDSVIDYAFGGSYRDKVVENFSMQTLTDSFIVGAMTSIAMGAASDLTVHVAQGSVVGVNKDMELFKLGFFKSMNLRKSMEALQDLRETVNNEKASVEQRAKAALALEMAVATIGNVYHNMGEARAIQADKVINDIAKMQEKQEKLDAFKSLPDYVNDLWSTFTNSMDVAQIMSTIDGVKVKRSMNSKDVGTKLKKAGVTEVEAVVTNSTKAGAKNGKIVISDEALANMKAALEKLGVDVIVGVNGSLVTKSDDVLFVDGKLLKSGDIAEIVKGIAYDQVVDSVAKALDNRQLEFIGKVYTDVTGLELDMTEAITALLFDKSFYTYVLAKSKERGFQRRALGILATLNGVVSRTVGKEVTKGNVTEKAYTKLMEKVMETMRTGLVNFATHSQMIDVGTIDNGVLPLELKAVILNHQNVVFTKVVNEGVKDKSNQLPTSERIEAYNKEIDRYASFLPAETIQKYKEAAASKNYNDRVDAYTTLAFLAKHTVVGNKKIVFLPAFEGQGDITVDDHVKALEETLGVSKDDFLNGNIDFAKLTDLANNFKDANAYDLSRAGRIAMMRDILYNQSGKTLTMDLNGNLMKVIEKSKFVKARYSGAKGTQNLRQDIVDGKIKTIQDLTDIKLDPKLGQIILDMNSSEIKKGVVGTFSPKENRILISGTNGNKIVDTIMHELTHATQHALNAGGTNTVGGNLKMFEVLPDKVRDDLTEYLKENFPNAYDLMVSKKNMKPIQVMYFSLEGELQANAYTNTLMFENGFTWKNGRTILVSPDGMREWSMMPEVNAKAAQTKVKMQEAAEKSKPKVKPTEKVVKPTEKTETKTDEGVSEDRPLVEIEEIRLGDDKEVQEFMKDPEIDEQSILEKLQTNLDGTFKVKIYGNRVDIHSSEYTASQLWDAIESRNLFGKESNGWMTAYREQDMITLDKDKIKIDKVALKKNGRPIILYRGAKGTAHMLHSGHVYFSTDPAVAVRYAKKASRQESKEQYKDTLTGFISNLKESDIIDLRNVSGTGLKFMGSDTMKAGTMLSDTFVQHVKAKYPDKKALWTDTGVLVVLEKGYDTLKRVTKEDYGKFAEAYNKSVAQRLQDNQTNAMKWLSDFNKSGKTASEMSEGELVNYLKMTMAEDAWEFVKSGDKYVAKNVDGFTFKLKGQEVKFDKDMTEELMRDNNFEKMLNMYYKYEDDGISESRSVAKNLRKIKSSEKADARRISKVGAGDSNLKYFVGKDVDLSLQNFIRVTTKNFVLLPKAIRDKITSGTLNTHDISEFVASRKNMNDYTFQSIARYVYHNLELAKLTFADMQSLIKSVNGLHVISYVLDADTNNTHMTPKEMIALSKEMGAKTHTDKVIDVKMARASEKVAHIHYKGALIPIEADPRQLNTIFFNHYDGTLKSMRSINSLGKYLTVRQIPLEFFENVDTGKITSAGTSKEWNWVDNMVKSDIEDEDVLDALSEISREEKVQTIVDYIRNTFADKLSEDVLNKMDEDARNEFMEQQTALMEKMVNKLMAANDEHINQRYVLTIQQLPQEVQTALVSNTLNMPEPPKMNETQIRQSINSKLYQVGKKIQTRIAGLKARYNLLPPEVKALIDPKTYKLNYKSVDKRWVKNDKGEDVLKIFGYETNEQMLNTLNLLRDGAEILKESVLKETAKANEKRLKEAAEKIAQQSETIKKLKSQKKSGKVSLREKIKYEHKIKIVNTNYTFSSGTEITTVARKLLETQWNKRATSKVQGMTNNVEQNVNNTKQFYIDNANILLGMTVAEAEATLEWFMDAKISDDTELKTFSAVKLAFMAYVLGETGKGKSFQGLNHNLKTRAENRMREIVTEAGTVLSIWNKVRGQLNPLDDMKNAEIEIGGVLLTQDEKDDLFDAAGDGDIPRITMVQAKILERIAKEKTSKVSVWRKISTIRSWSMLSSPITWLRNLASNETLKRLNTWSSKIGDAIFPSRTAPNQLKMKAPVTGTIQQFINKEFIDNGLFDTIVSNISKYNPSDINKKYKDASGKATKEGIFINLAIKSMYGEFYNQNMFKWQKMNNFHKWLMKRLSDNNYVREATVRYLGKIIAERGYALDQGITDNIMNDFAMAVGMGMSDYMHSDNMFNRIETMLAEKSEAALFAYKLVMPFASASWNWFKAAIRFSPIGLAKSIVQLSKLEKQVIKAEQDWAAGKAQVSPEMTEFLIRRNLGSGVIGTVAFGLGVILAMMGYVSLEEDDYGTPKLMIGNLKIDVSTLFGTSSALAGMAFVKGWQDGDFLDALDDMMDPLLDGFFFLELLEMDQYNNGGFASFGAGYMEQVLLSFIPNAFRWISGLFYTGTYKPNNIFEKAVVRLPFLGSAFNVQKKTNPYTGSQGDLWDIFNRVVPFFEVRSTSAIEDESKQMGINKTQLRGDYEVNGEKFKLSAKETAALNKAYGQWNANALQLFYDNKTRMSVRMPNGSYKELTYIQMTPEQQKNAVQNIFTKNAEYAKISAWLKAGNAYYASSADYVALRKLGIEGALFKGSKGFVKK